MTVLENYSLENLNTFRLRSIARYFVVIKNDTDLIEAVYLSRKVKLPIFILGGGSNLVLPENLNAVVLKSEIKGKGTHHISNGIVRVALGSGEDWEETVNFCVKNNYAGLENLSGVPGTVGASAVQNIGAYGVEAGEFISSVETFDLTTLTKKIWLAKDCEFGYRDSVFKKPGNKKYFITKVNFDLRVGGQPRLSYRDLQDHFIGRTPTIKEAREFVIKIRKEKMPDLTVCGCAGSFFKNPVISKDHYEALIDVYPGVPKYALPDGRIKIPLAFILDHVCHLKGLKWGNLSLYEKQPLVLVNFGGGTVIDIENFAQSIFDSVKNKTNIEIEWEAEKVDFNK